jgi:hypothetical protein
VKPKLDVSLLLGNPGYEENSPVRWFNLIGEVFRSVLSTQVLTSKPIQTAHMLTRVVRKALVTFEAINAQGDTSTVDVNCLAPELTPRPLLGVLCDALLVLCRDPSNGQDPNCQVDLWVA